MGEKKSRRRDYFSSDERDKLIRRIEKLEKKRKHKKKKSRHRKRYSSTSSSSDSAGDRIRSERNHSNSRNLSPCDSRSPKSSGNPLDQRDKHASGARPLAPSQTPDDENASLGVSQTLNTPPPAIDSMDVNKKSSTAPTGLQSADSSKNGSNDKDLNSEILNVIGQQFQEERAFAPPVHADFAVRWAEIMKLGISSSY